MRSAIIIHLFSCLIVFGHPRKISLPTDTPFPRIGHVHAFADKGQTIPVLIPGDAEIKAHLFRLTGSTTIPTGPPILVPASDHAPTPITIDFPPSEKPTQYILVFDTPERPRLRITVLPLNHLDTLRNATRTAPIHLVRSPGETTHSLQQLGLSVQDSEAPPTEKNPITIVFNPTSDEARTLRSARNILVDPACPKGRQTWVSRNPGKWRITVHPETFTSQTLGTASGQAMLAELLQGQPETN